ncbi:MAG: TraB/GumN family protein [Clostridia bacterium]|nr:TraB/GumN family protein [Clostridia bacterium]
MKFYTKLLSLLLTLSLLLSFVACNGGKDENSKDVSAEESVSSEESSASDEERAAAAYDTALSALKDKKDVKQLIQSTVIRTAGKDVFTVETETTVLRIDGKFYLNEKTEVDDKVLKNEKFFADGKYTYVSGDDCYYKEMEAEAAEEMLLPVVLLDKELYETLLFDGEDESTLVLSGATAIEAWMAPEYAAVKTAEGKIKLDDKGEISAYEYKAEYTQGSAEYTAQYSVTLSAPEEDDKIELPEKEATELDSIELIDMLEMAYIATHRLISFDFDYSIDIYSQPGTIGWTSSENIYTYGKGKDDFLTKTKFNQKIIQGNKTQSNSGEQSYKDGKLTTVIDGKESSVNSSMEDILKSVKEKSDALSLLQPDMTLFENYEIKDLGGYWYISYTLNEEGGKGCEDYVSEYFFGPSDAIDELADEYSTEKAELYISIDKDTLIITAAGIDFECIHKLDGHDYKSGVMANVSYAIGNVSTYEEITGELPEEEEPEEKARPLFYKVTSAEGKIMYLLGTIHIGDSRTAYLPKEIYDALESSDALAVEVNMPKYEDTLEEDEELLEAYLKGYYYSDDSLITDHIDEELYKEARPYVLAAGLSGYHADYMTPAAWEETIGFLYKGSMHDLSSLYGVDRRLITIANDKEIKIYDVEDPKEHIGLAGNYTDAIHEVLLKSAISATKHEYLSDIRDLFNAWCEGDEEGLIEHIREEEYPEDATEEELAAMKAYDKMLLADRDAIMVEKAKEYLEGDETIFFAVGLAHVLSETGLVESLRAEGYTVELVEYAK